jgi:1-acyl-sn-glycerol-3-phosphate acyltransferase
MSKKIDPGETRKINLMLELIRILARLLIKMEVIDYDKIPQSGAFLLTTNHISRQDTPLLMLSTPRKDVIGIVAKNYQEHKLIAWLMRGIGVIWMSREESDFPAFREAVSFLNHGWVVGIAPEGTRSREQKMLEGKAGAALLAERAQVLIIPVAIWGSADLIKDLKHFRRNRVTICYGRPYKLPPLGDSDHKEWLQKSTDEIMCRIAALLPEQYRGFYAEHPRLKELIAQ